MTNKNNILITTIIIAILCAAGFFVGRCSFTPKETIRYITKIDTAWQVMPAETLLVEGKGKIQYKDKDRIIFVPAFRDTCKPFASLLDTIIKKDTLTVRYDYPANNFYVALHQHPDSVMTRTIYIMNEPKADKRPLWLDILSHTGSAVIGGIIGFGIGRIK